MRVVIAVFALLFSLVACAEGTAYKAGVHYEVLEQPVQTIDPQKIEVTEVFWYGCGHCFRFEPMLHQWSSKLADDVVFRQSPAMWNDTMAVHARAFYVAQALKVLDKVHQPLFNALNIEGKRLADQDELADFFVAQGIERDTFLKAYKSFGVTGQVKQADVRARAYQITGTPEIVVNGKYRVSARMAGGQAQMLKVADYLIQQERAAQSL